MGNKAFFTEKMLTGFASLGRGIGVSEYYVPWHRITRSDPSSCGLSHLQNWHGRQREFLSDGELVAFLFSTMLPNVIDIREQFPLSTIASRHELNDYQAGARNQIYPGTLELASRLNIKHPMVRGKGTSAPWIATTDILITLRLPSGDVDFIAIAVKPAKECAKESVLRRLSLERQYWMERDVKWLLINETLYEPLVADTLKSTRAWALEPQVDLPITQWLRQRIDVFNRCNLTHILNEGAVRWGNKEAVQRAFWRAIWLGHLPFDLKRSWRPSAPFIALPQDQFWQRNPIYCGRSAWKT